MIDKEKIEKFELIQAKLWQLAKDGPMLQSLLAGALIRIYGIPSPTGEDPESA